MIYYRAHSDGTVEAAEATAEKLDPKMIFVEDGFYGELGVNVFDNEIDAAEACVEHITGEMYRHARKMEDAMKRLKQAEKTRQAAYKRNAAKR